MRSCVLLFGVCVSVFVSVCVCVCVCVLLLFLVLALPVVWAALLVGGGGVALASFVSSVRLCGPWPFLLFFCVLHSVFSSFGVWAVWFPLSILMVVFLLLL